MYIHIYIYNIKDYFAEIVKERRKKESVLQPKDNQYIPFLAPPQPAFCIFPTLIYHVIK